MKKFFDSPLCFQQQVHYQFYQETISGEDQRMILSPNNESESLQTLISNEGPAQRPPNLQKLSSSVDQIISSPKGEQQIRLIKPRPSVRQAKMPSKTTFNQDLVSNTLYVELQKGITAFSNNKLSESEMILNQLVENACSKLRYSQNKQFEKQYTLICIQCEYYLSRINQSQGKLQTAIGRLEKILKSYTIHDLHTLAQLHLSLGTINRILLKLENSLRHFYEALTLYERLNWQVEQADCMMRLGIIYGMLNDGEKAKRLTYEALIIYKRNLIESDIKFAKAYLNLGKIFYYSQEFEISYEYLSQSLELYVSEYKSEFDYNLIAVYNQIAINLQFQEQYEESIAYYGKAIFCFRGTIEVQLGQIFNNLGLCYFELKSRQSALEYFDKAEQIYSIYFRPNHPLRSRLSENRNLLNQKKI
ncbi:hypothetical protein pb186bvf_016363 [Paramecium bursaria]